MIDLKKIGSGSILTALAVFSVIAIPAAAQYDIYDLGYNVTTQDIQADNTNAVHLVWTNGNVLNYGRIVNNALTGKVQVATGISTLFWRPYVSVRPDGRSVHITWCQGGGKGNKLMHSWRDSAGEWRTETVYQVPLTQSISQPACAVDGTGQVHVLFLIFNDVSTNMWTTIFYMRSLAGGEWGPCESFAPELPEHKYPMMFTDSTGDVHATWCIIGSGMGDAYDAYYCTAQSGRKLSFASTIKIPKGSGTDVNGYGDLYVDRNGVVHRAIGGWSKTQQKMCIDHSKKLPGGSFSVPTRPSIGFLALANCDPVPCVAAAEDGTTIVAWGQVGADGSNQVKASFYDPDGNAWTLTTVDPAAGVPLKPNAYRVAVTRTDTHMFGVWRGSNGHLKLFVLPIDGSGPPPPPPEGGDPVASFTATPTSGASPLVVTFDGSASYDTDGSIVSYDWNFGDGGTAAGAIVTHTYTTSGTFSASLTVTDNDGKTGNASGDIQVSNPNQPPVADFNFTPSTGIYPCEIAFDGGPSRDPDGTIVDYSWNFGDGGRGSGRVPRHTYTRWGTFSVSLTVWDDSGASANKVRSIEIRRIFQPLSIRWESHKDESLFQTRYVNEVSWERNPANDSLGVQIVLHRIWRKKTGESDLAFKPVGEVTGDVYSYIDKGAGSDNTCVYTVTARDSQGHESPIVGGGGNSSLLQPRKDSQPLFRRDKLGEK
jgi:chitodextrinase/predicted DNA-binding WGR domain protein